MTPLPVLEIVYNPKLEMVYLFDYFGRHSVQGLCIDKYGDKRKIVIPIHAYNDLSGILKEQDQLFKLIQDINSNILSPIITVVNYTPSKENWK